MHWISRLNRHTGPIQVLGTTVELLGFHYQPQLNDNVPHRHTYFEVCLVGNHGAGVFKVQDVPHDLAPGNLFFARPGVIHQIRNTLPVGMELYWVSFAWPGGEKTRARNLGEGARILEPFANSSSLVLAEAGVVTQLWLALRAVAEANEVPGKDAQIAALIEALLLAIAQTGAGSTLPAAPAQDAGPEHFAAKIAVRYIHDNLAGALGVEEIALQVALSARHLARVFQRFTGTSPATYIETARLDRAKHLLVHTDKSIKEIATAVGYGDYHHFSRVFARRCGQPPGKWRQAGGAPPVIRHPGDLV